MKTNDACRILIFAIFFSGLFSSLAQTKSKGDVTTPGYQNLLNVYAKIIADAKIDKTLPSSSCMPNKIIKEVDQLLKNEKNLEKYLFQDFEFYYMNVNFHTALPNIDKGVFATREDKILYTIGNAPDYASFVSQLTGKSPGELSKKTKKKMLSTYSFFKTFLIEKKAMGLINGNEDPLKYKNCLVFLWPQVKTQSFKYPNITYELKLNVKTLCECEEGSGPTSLKDGTFEYVALSKGTYTGVKPTFENPTNVKIVPMKFECCPEKTETKKTARTASAEGSSHFIKDTRNIFLNPSAVNEYKNYVVTEWGKDKEEQNDPNAEGGFFREAGSFAYGVYLGKPVGKEKDFFGFSYGGELGYYHGLSKKFQIGASAGYMHFTGKETDFGFETKGEGFIPILIHTTYLITQAFGVEGGLGYSIATGEGGEGGLTYSLGPFWKPLEAVLFYVEYTNIAFGEGSLGAFMLGTRFSLSKK